MRYNNNSNNTLHFQDQDDAIAYDRACLMLLLLCAVAAIII